LEMLAERGPRIYLAGLFSALKWDVGWLLNIGHCFLFERALASLPDKLPRIIFLHDVIPLRYPEFQKKTSAAHFRAFCRFLNYPASRILVSSETTAAALKEPAIASLFSAVDQEVSVLPLPVEESFASFGSTSGSRQVPDEPHFVAVGTIEPRKNVELLLKVWELLADGDRSVPKLYWVGKRGWFRSRRVKRQFVRLIRAGCFVECSGISDTKMQSLVGGARALLFPSLAEGWGLPLSEALSMKCPVIAANIPVFHEVGQGVPDFASPYDVNAWRNLIVDYAEESSGKRAAQLGRMEAYRATSWELHFEALEESGRVGELESGRVAGWQSGRVVEWESGRVARVAEWESGRVGEL
jgi:glycosyltransferase involved in cell wall biosynthesis